MSAPRRLSRAERLALSRRFGREIRKLREGRGQTQEAFAEQAGLAARNYGAIERGEHSITFATLFSIARALGVPAAEIVRRVEEL